MYQHKHGIISIVILLVLCICINIITIDHVSALTFSDTLDLEFTFNPVVSISLSDNLVIPSLAPGDAVDSNIISIQAGTNNPSGYTLYTTAGSSTSSYTDLRLDPTNTTNVFTTLTSNSPTLASFGNSMWGYAYSLDRGNSWYSGNINSKSSGYNGLPLYTTTGIVLADTTTAMSTNLEFKIAAHAATTQAVGTYTNVINFIGVTKVLTTTYNLSYYANSDSDASTNNNITNTGNGTSIGTTSNMPSPATITAGTTTNALITLSNAIPERDNYTFIGWCDNPVVLGTTTIDNGNGSETVDVLSETSCSSNIYLPGRTYHLPYPGGSNVATNNNTDINDIKLYAIWSSNHKTIRNSEYLQDVELCDDTVPLETTYTLKDKRDEKTYTVAKLKDGNCWMTQNLDLDGGTVIDSTLSDIADPTYTLPLANGFQTNNRLPKSETFQSGSTTNLVNTSAFSDDTKAYVFNSNNHTDSCTSTKPCYSYYSWIAATAGSGASITTTDQEAPYSICPRGWRLPTSTRVVPYTDSDFYQLMYQYGMTDTTTNPTAYYYADANTSPNGASVFANIREGTIPNFLRAGYFYGGTFSYGGSLGSYWSASAAGSSNAYNLNFNSTNVYSAGRNSRRYGFSVRCIFGG